MNTVTYYISNILAPEQASCVFDALPLPSAIIHDVVVPSDDVIVLNHTSGSGSVGIVRVWVEWKQPSSSVMAYIVRATEQQAFEEDGDFGELFVEQMVNVSY